MATVSLSWTPIYGRRDVIWKPSIGEKSKSERDNLEKYYGIGDTQPPSPQKWLMIKKSFND